jgi:chaperone modulatory protein CbpM
MKTVDEVLKLLQDRLDRAALETFIERQWIRPHRKQEIWYFEEIDIARIELVCHLTQDIEVNDEGMDVVLSLLDQLYTMRAHVKHLNHAIKQQPADVQTKIMNFLKELTAT